MDEQRLAEKVVEQQAKIDCLNRSMRQMREDFRRIQMIAEQHGPSDASIKSEPK